VRKALGVLFISSLVSFTALFVWWNWSYRPKSLPFWDAVAYEMEYFRFWPTERIKAKYQTFAVYKDLDINGVRDCMRYMIGEKNLCVANRRCVEQGRAEFEEILKDAPADGIERWFSYRRLSSLLAYEERTLPAARDVLLEASRQAEAQGARRQSLRYLARAGVADMRLGEITNCNLNHNAESCVFPIARAAQHQDRRGSEAAMLTYLRFLQRRPDDLHIQFLLNIVAQTLGQWPAGVPERFLMREAETEEMRAVKFPRFANIADEIGLNDRARSGRGVAIDDFDGDGHRDIIMASRYFCDEILYMKGDGRGGFQPYSVESGLDQELYVINLYQADYDNDGDLDLFITRGAFDEWPLENSDVFNALLQNDGRGRFRDVSLEVGLERRWATSTVARWFDANSDGWLDLLVCHDRSRHEFYLSDGRGKFRQALDASGILPYSVCKGIAVGDVNGDQHLDLYISNLNQENQLYFGRGDGSFERQQQRAVEVEPILSFTTFFVDLDNDGDLDLVNVDFDLLLEHAVESWLGRESQGHRTRIWLNDGRGQFNDATRAWGLDKTFMAMAAQIGDLDNDGYKDLFIGTGSFGLADLFPNKVFVNREGQRFVDVTTKGGFGNLQKGHGISFADLDADGDQDVIAMFGGKSQADMFFQSLYENPGFGNAWVSLKLEGVQSSRSAIDSQIEIHITEGGRQRRVFHHVNHGATFGANTLTAEIGLGQAHQIDKLIVRWLSGQVQEFTNVSARRHYFLREGDAQLTVLDRRPMPLRKNPRRHEHHRDGSHAHH
jgi:hypothetical protein